MRLLWVLGLFAVAQGFHAGQEAVGTGLEPASVIDTFGPTLSPSKSPSVTLDATEAPTPSPVTPSTPTESPVATSPKKEPSNCVDSLNDIYEAEQAVDDDNVVRVYILCPETTYTVADSFNDGAPSDNGQYPLSITRPNIHIQCGEDGDSSNNCVLEGGHAQLVMKNSYFSDLGDLIKIENAIVQGVTFTDGKTSNILVEGEGNLVIFDCVFRDNTNVSPVSIIPVFDGVMSTFGVDTAGQGTAGDNTTDTNLEEKGKSGTHKTNVVMSGCVFLDNVIWPYSGETIEGLVRISQGANVEISDSIFMRTTTQHDEETKLEYQIFNEGGRLALNNNCFLDNDDTIAPVVNLNHAVLQTYSNSVQRSTAELPPTKCQFISFADALHKDSFDSTTFGCEEADTPVCTAKALSKVTPTCADRLDDIYDSEQDLESDEGTRTYRLCPNTTFGVKTVGELSGDQNVPLVIGRSNIQVLCGADGFSHNSCVLSGGAHQMTVHNEFRVDGDVPPENVLIHGITFKDALSTNVAVKMPCDVEFKDCIFERNSNLATIYIDVNGDDERRRNMAENSFPRSSLRNDSKKTERSLDSQITPVVTISECVFQNISVGTVPRTSSGVITNYGGRLSLFRNTFSDIITVPEQPKRTDEASYHSGYSAEILDLEDESDVTFAGYIIGSLDGDLELKNNCFVDNQVTLAQVMSIKGTIDADMNGGSTNFVTKETGNPNHVCEFVAVVDPNSNVDRIGGVTEIRDFTQLSSDVSITCIDFDTHECTTGPGTDPGGSWSGKEGDGSGHRLSTAALCLIILSVLIVLFTVAFSFRHCILRRGKCCGTGSSQSFPSIGDSSHVDSVMASFD